MHLRNLSDGNVMKLGIAPVINASANVRDCQLGRYTQVGPRTSMIESTHGDYCHVVNDAEIIYTAIGKFCSIAVMVRINPGNHPMWRASQSHFTYRAGHKVVQAHGLSSASSGRAALLARFTLDSRRPRARWRVSGGLKYTLSKRMPKHACVEGEMRA